VLQTLAGIHDEEKSMNKLSSRIGLAAMCLALGACASTPTYTEVGTATGAVVGGVVGAAVTGGSTVGTVGGAAAGALIGHEVGKRMK
jgi:osmotically inducible lipoprotein OsmB